MVTYGLFSHHSFVQVVQAPHDIEGPDLEDVALRVAVEAVHLARVLLWQLLVHPLDKVVIKAWETIVAFVEVR